MSNDLVPKKDTSIESLIKIDHPTLTDDFQFAKANMQDVIYKGNDLLNDLVDVAKSSQQARSFEVAANLIKILVDANKQMMETALMDQELIRRRKQNGEEPETNKTTNNILVMSTNELLEKLASGNTVIK